MPSPRIEPIYDGHSGPARPETPVVFQYLSTAIYNPKFMDPWASPHQPEALLTANESTLLP